MFAPVAYEEFARVLKKSDYLIIGAAGEKHLDGLKAILYDEVYLNEPSEHKNELFDNISVENLSYVTEVSGNEIINSLFTMTPYYHRTSLADKEKLSKVDSLTTTVEVDFFILRRV
jgi:23S rRNA (guanine745-N1)-methyltransferase